MNTNIRRTIAGVAERLRTPLHLVGGPVRDALLHRPCHDWDFVCPKAKRMAAGTAKALHAKLITLDEQYRIYRVIQPEGVTLDFAERQGKTIQADLARRDFTVNAMARAFPEGKILDPFGGQQDLKKRLIRGVSAKAFAEDPLRTLRAFRFAAQFGFSIESRTLDWVRAHRSGLAKVSAERIREELLRFFKQPRTGGMFRLMDNVRLLTQIFPEIEACRRSAIRYYGKGGVLKHSFETLENLEWIFQNMENLKLIPESALAPIRTYLYGIVGGFPRAAWLKWAAFLHDVGKPATAKVIRGRLRFFEHEHVGAELAMQIGRRLRLSRQEVQLLGLWVRNHMRTGNLAAAPRYTEKALSRYFRDLGEEGVGMILVSLADHYTYLARPRWGRGADPVEKVSAQLLSAYYEKRAKILPERLVDGHVLMKKLRLKPGPLIGELLEAVQDAQAEGKVRTLDEAIAFARKKARC